MDKRKVIDAYRRGFLTLQECAQILGMENAQMVGLLGDVPDPDESERGTLFNSRKATGNV